MLQQDKPEEALAILNTAASRQLINDIREGIAQLIQGEGRLLAERQAEAEHERYLLAVLIGFAPAGGGAALRPACRRRRCKPSGISSTAPSELETESKLRQEAESTLLQAQKMEAVGQLTGGVAHDFNNLLTIIIGNLDTMRRQLADLANTGTGAELRAKLTKPLDSAVQGAKSAAQLTQSLLAFSRRQALEPARIDANRLVSGMLDMLQRSLGAEISVETVLGAGRLADLRRRPPIGERAAQSRAECQGCDAGGRLSHHRDGQHLSGCRPMCAASATSTPANMWSSA